MFERLHETVRGLVQKISETELKPGDLRSILWDFKLALLENDVAMVVADHVCEEIEKRLTGLRVGRFSDKEKLVKETLRTVLLEILEPPEHVDLVQVVVEKRIFCLRKSSRLFLLEATPSELVRLSSWKFMLKD